MSGYHIHEMNETAHLAQAMVMSEISKGNLLLDDYSPLSEAHHGKDLMLGFEDYYALVTSGYMVKSVRKAYSLSDEEVINWVNVSVEDGDKVGILRRILCAHQLHLRDLLNHIQSNIKKEIQTLSVLNWAFKDFARNYVNDGHLDWGELDYLLSEKLENSDEYSIEFKYLNFSKLTESAFF